MTACEETLNDMFEDVARQQGEAASVRDVDPIYQANLEKKRVAEIERQIRQGLRDENGDWIEPPEDEGDDDAIQND